NKLACRQVVVWTRIDPEELRVAGDLGQRRLVDTLGMSEDGFEQIAHLQVMAMALVVIYVAAGNRGLIEMPDENLLVERQRDEAVRVHLNDGRILDLLQQIRSPIQRRVERHQQRWRLARLRASIAEARPGASG